MSDENLARQPGERYFTWIKRCAENEAVRKNLLHIIAQNISIYSLDVEKHWPKICREAKAYGILQRAWRRSKR